jgi:hypothetical protein
MERRDSRCVRRRHRVAVLRGLRFHQAQRRAAPPRPGPVRPMRVPAQDRHSDARHVPRVRREERGDAVTADRRAAPPARPPQRRTWRGTIAVWAIATGVLLALVLPVSKVDCMISYAEWIAHCQHGQCGVGLRTPWEPDFTEVPFISCVVTPDPVRVGGLPWAARRNYEPGYDAVLVVVPLWLIAIVGGAVAAWAWRRRQGRRAGFCRCGYSLAGLGAGAVCPECGAERTAAKKWSGGEVVWSRAPRCEKTRMSAARSPREDAKGRGTGQEENTTKARGRAVVVAQRKSTTLAKPQGIVAQEKTPHRRRRRRHLTP